MIRGIQKPQTRHHTLRQRQHSFCIALLTSLIRKRALSMAERHLLEEMNSRHCSHEEEHTFVFPISVLVRQLMSFAHPRTRIGGVSKDTSYSAMKVNIL